MTFILILLLIGILWYLFYAKKSNVEVKTFPKSWHQILAEKVIYYKNLAPDDRTKFAEDVMRFLAVCE
jgi:Mlc titration factor MtfA (ptsG expression regulator)